MAYQHVLPLENDKLLSVNEGQTALSRLDTDRISMKFDLALEAISL